MQHHFAVRRREFWIAVFGVAFFSFMAIGFAFVIPADGGPGVFAIVISLFWSVLAIVSAYCMFTCWRARLELSREEIVETCLIREVRLPVDRIKSLKWTYVHRSVKIRTDAKRMTIQLMAFEPHEQLAIIRFLREYVPENAQHDWQSFCHVTAMRLLEGEPDPDRDPRYVRLTRRRWDRLFAVSIGAIAVFLVPTAWWLSQPVMLIAPFAVLPLWLIIRFSTPAKGNSSMRMSAEKGGRFLYFAGVWLLVGFVGSYLTWPSAPALAIDEIPWRVWLFLFTWCAVVFWQAHVADKRQKRNLLEGSQESVERWNLLCDIAPAANA